MFTVHCSATTSYSKNKPNMFQLRTANVGGILFRFVFVYFIFLLFVFVYVFLFIFLKGGPKLSQAMTGSVGGTPFSIKPIIENLFKRLMFETYTSASEKALVRRQNTSLQGQLYVSSFKPEDDLNLIEYRCKQKERKGKSLKGLRWIF